jgi:hypothetical protein
MRRRDNSQEPRQPSPAQAGLDDLSIVFWRAAMHELEAEIDQEAAQRRKRKIRVASGTPQRESS